jgi:hypothetical protein
MEVSKIKSIIEEQNRNRERNAFREAESIIESIASLQASKVTTENKIAELRKRLNDLHIEQLSESDILGGE